MHYVCQRKLEHWQKSLDSCATRRPNGAQTAVVPTTSELLRALRMKYNAAYSAHQGLATQVARAAMAGKRPSDALRDGEKRSALELAAARERLRVAIAESAGESRRADGDDRR